MATFFQSLLMSAAAMITWANLGLLFDIIGVWILAFALVWQSAQFVHRKSATVWDWNEALARDMCTQQVDAATGAILITIGFVLQIFSSSLPLSQLAVICAGAFALFAMVAFWIFIRSKIISRLWTRVRDIDHAKFPRKGIGSADEPGTP